MKNIFKFFIRLLCVVLLASVCACGVESDWEKLEEAVTDLKEEVQKSSPDDTRIKFLEGEIDRLCAIPEVKARVNKQASEFEKRHPQELKLVASSAFSKGVTDNTQTLLSLLYFAAIIGENGDGDNPALDELRAFLNENFPREKKEKDASPDPDLDSEKLKKNVEETAAMVSSIAEATTQLVSEAASEVSYVVSDSVFSESKKDGSQAVSTEPATAKKSENAGPEKSSSKLNKKNVESKSLKPFTLVLPDGARMEFMPIPAGTFVMGSPEDEEGRADDENQVCVNITKAFYMGKTEVTEAQYSVVIDDDSPSNNGKNEPVTNVCWDDAMSFCKQLTAWAHSQGKMLGWKFTLPTEAQWEYACRAGTTTEYHSGDKLRDLKRVAWYCDNSGWGPEPVGRKEPNAWGLYDMHGNVWEWCLDWYARNLQGGENPTGPKSGSNASKPSPASPSRKSSRRVSRGGGWNLDPRYCRSACRRGNSPAGRYFYLGFRVALVWE